MAMAPPTSRMQRTSGCCRANPPRRSSRGLPSACITPSSVTLIFTTILLIPSIQTAKSRIDTFRTIFFYGSEEPAGRRDDRNCRVLAVAGIELTDEFRALRGLYEVKGDQQWLLTS